jgi:hypothetical protein
MSLLFWIIFSASVTNFFPSVVDTLGYGDVESLLLTVPPYVLGIFFSAANAWHADRTGERYLHVTLPLCVAVIAFIIAATTLSIVPRYISMCLMIPGIYSSFVVALGWISNTITRPSAKRAAALAMVTAVGNSSSIYASYLFEDSMAPRYVLAMSVCSGVVFLAICSATILKISLRRLNRRLEQGLFVEGVTALGNTEPSTFRFLT